MIITIFKFVTNYFKNDLQVFLLISFFLTSKEIRRPVHCYYFFLRIRFIHLVANLFNSQIWLCFQVFFPSRFLVLGCSHFLRLSPSLYLYTRHKYSSLRKPVYGCSTFIYDFLEFSLSIIV